MAEPDLEPPAPKTPPPLPAPSTDLVASPQPVLDSQQQAGTPVIDLSGSERSTQDDSVLALAADQLTIAHVEEYIRRAHTLVVSFPESFWPVVKAAIDELEVDRTAWLIEQMLETYKDVAARKRDVSVLAMRVQPHGRTDLYLAMWGMVGKFNKTVDKLEQDLQVYLNVQVYRGKGVKDGVVSWYAEPGDMDAVCRRNAGRLILAMQTVVEVEALLRTGNYPVWSQAAELVGRWRHLPDGFLWITHVLGTRGYGYIMTLTDREGMSLSDRLQGIRDEVPQTAAQLTAVVWQAAKMMHEPTPDYPAITRLLELAQQRLRVVANSNTIYKHFGGHFALTSATLMANEAESSLSSFATSARRGQRLRGLADRYARGIEVGAPVFEVTGGERDYGSTIFQTIDDNRHMTWLIPATAAAAAALVVFAPEILAAGKEGLAALATWAMANPDKAQLVAEFLFTTGVTVAEMGPHAFLQSLTTPEGVLRLAADVFILRASMGPRASGSPAPRPPTVDATPDLPGPTPRPPGGAKPRVRGPSPPDVDVPAPAPAPAPAPPTPASPQFHGTRGAKLASQRGLPEAETGYHWAVTSKGELAYRRNPGTSSTAQQRRYNAQTKSFENAPTKFSEMSYDDLGKVRPCFVAGTLVATERGPRPIEDLAAGDRVWSWDASRRIARLCEVVTVHRGTTERLIDLDDGRATVTTTWHHPIAVGGDWRTAGELTIAHVPTLSGSRTRLIAHPRRTSPVDTFNLEVAELHNFHVGAAGLRVHNGFEDSDFNNTERKLTEIYAIRDFTQGGKIIYVGKTFQGQQVRFDQHLDLRTGWKAKFEANQLQIEPLARGNWTTFDTAVMEEHHIRDARNAGHPLENNPKKPPIGRAKFDHFKKLHNTC